MRHLIFTSTHELRRVEPEDDRFLRNELRDVSDEGLRWQAYRTSENKLVLVFACGLKCLQSHQVIRDFCSKELQGVMVAAGYVTKEGVVTLGCKTRLEPPLQPTRDECNLTMGAVEEYLNAVRGA